MMLCKTTFLSYPKFPPSSQDLYVFKGCKFVRFHDRLICGATYVDIIFKNFNVQYKFY